MSQSPSRVLAEVALLPPEAKILIARAVASMEAVARALTSGLIVMHPSSSTWPILQALTGKAAGGIWVLGIVRPKGLCISYERQQATRSGDGLGQPLRFPHSWVLRRGVLEERQPLGELLQEMGPGDLYIKGCNALDAGGNAGVLFASPGAGTIGRVVAAARERCFSILLPVGLEKMIPGSIREAAHAARIGDVRYALGQRCGLLPVPGEVVHEARALSMLCGVECRAIAAGGLGGGEGSTVLLIEGEEAAVQAAFELVRSIKGLRLPPVLEVDCVACPVDRCLMPR